MDSREVLEKLKLELFECREEANDNLREFLNMDKEQRQGNSAVVTDWRRERNLISYFLKFIANLERRK